MRRSPAVLLVLLAFSPICRAQSVVVEKPGMEQLLPANAVVEKLLGGFQFLEGPAYSFRGGFLVFSDIPADRMYRCDPGATAATIFRHPSHHANGNLYDAAGELITCEQGSRSVTILRTDGKVDVLADRFEDKALNSPNDVAAKSDGTVWFTDPPYGLEGRPREQAVNNVFCADPRTHSLRVVAADFDGPNGICFSPDERKLYIADTGAPHWVRVFDVTPENTLANGRVFCTIRPGAADGIRCDHAGNLWCAAGDGVHIYNPAGERLGKILLPETPANLCFGGADDLYITARTSLYHVKLAPPAK